MARWGAFLLGAALFGGLALGWQVDRGVSGRADVALAAARHDSLDVQPAAHVLARGTLAPSLPAGGIRALLSARNATAGALFVTLRAAAETHSLDDALRLRIRSGTRVVFAGTLRTLRRGTPLGPLSSRASLDLDAEAWIPVGTRHGFESRRERIVLSFATRPLGGAA